MVNIVSLSQSVPFEIQVINRAWPFKSLLYCWFFCLCRNQVSLQVYLSMVYEHYLRIEKCFSIESHVIGIEERS